MARWMRMGAGEIKSAETYWYQGSPKPGDAEACGLKEALI
ncbi:hypothetical protein L195_g027322 [Trifolium pratense]|uniref:Uncharacterized protein n=1 Tax=Trifolium pratense TaxID=57577 RepID=A0A2K3KYU1_TRIPR|nr:hypothetical protein L195_g027322 [Trifolium pratense]